MTPIECFEIELGRGLRLLFHRSAQLDRLVASWWWRDRYLALATVGRA